MEDKNKNEEHKYLKKQHEFFRQIRIINPKINYQIITGSVKVIVIYFNTDFYADEIHNILREIIKAYEEIFKTRLTAIHSYPIAIAKINKYNTIYFMFREVEYTKIVNQITPTEEKELMTAIKLED